MRKPIYLLPREGKFYKTNLHCHTTVSDGKQTVQEVKEAYKAQGYSAVCFTDHEILLSHKDLCDSDFIALHGYEVAIKQDEGAHTAIFQPVYHFNLIAKDQDNLVMPNYYLHNRSWAGNAQAWAEKYAQYSGTIDHTEYDVSWINWFTKAAKEAGYLITYNHPMWSLHGPQDYLELENLHALELINSGSLYNLENTSLHYQYMLRAGKRLVPVGADDNHRLANCFLAWTMIKAPQLTYSSLMEAYEKGHCYASEGPEILALSLEDGKIKLDCSQAAAVYLHSQGRYAVMLESQEGITHAEFDYCPEKFGTFFRIEVKDATGRKAYSNAYYTQDLEKLL